MTERETLSLLAVISTAYPMIDMTDEYVDLWIKMMRNVDFKTATEALHKHILTNKYPPTIAEIAAVGHTEAERLKIETKERLVMISGWSERATLPAGREQA
ncbi:replicative helicase loader/inhibitor [Paenibacillus alvei]|uniref:Replicative helicase inhibitor G39P N-terminal domain-containing protein n=1 Tax=Paenibacillus alvei TaxID=44250 RepID=A0AAP6ZYP2_PAEAL|nr:hypothetical protein [Paenibacillus alvei]